MKKRINGFKIISLEQGGKRAVVACRCGETHIVNVESPRDGAVTCAAIPLTRAQRDQRYAAMRREKALQQLRRDMKALAKC